MSESCVVGKVVGGKQYLKAYVTLREPMDERTAADRIIKWCGDNLIRYSVPAFVEVLEAMPRTKLAKIDYKELENR